MAIFWGEKDPPYTVNAPNSTRQRREEKREKRREEKNHACHTQVPKCIYASTNGTAIFSLRCTIFPFPFTIFTSIKFIVHGRPFLRA